MDHQSIHAHASDIAGHSLGKCWTRWFRKRHPELVTSKPAKLDPKRAKNFNETIVKDYFEKWEALNTEYGGIPPEHIWNMDEKGIQMGGGRKNSGKTYFYLRAHRNRYRISSDNLELVMVIECVSAAGESVPTSFVLSDGPKPSYKTKEPLLAIANALKISDKGTKADLINRIQHHLDNNPQLRDNPRFAGLFQIPGSRRHLNHTETPTSEPSSSSGAIQAQVTQFQQAVPQPIAAPHIPDPYTYFNTFYNTALPPYRITHPIQHLGWPPGTELQAQAQAMAHNPNLNIMFNPNQ